MPQHGTVWSAISVTPPATIYHIACRYNGSTFSQVYVGHRQVFTSSSWYHMDALLSSRCRTLLLTVLLAMLLHLQCRVRCPFLMVSCAMYSRFPNQHLAFTWCRRPHLPFVLTPTPSSFVMDIPSWFVNDGAASCKYTAQFPPPSGQSRHQGCSDVD